MSTIGSVIIRLEAQHGQLTNGLEDAGKGVHEFGSKLKEMGAGLAEGLGIGAGIELAKAGIEAVTDAVKESIATVKEWVGETLSQANANLRLAATLHIHTETLGGLQVAAKKAGVDHEQLTNALEKLNAKIGEAATKGGESTEVFKKLGLSAGGLANQSLDKSLNQISDALARVKNPAEQAALVGELLGEKIGGKLVGTLTKGSAALDEITEHARHMGVAMDDVDTGKLAATQRTFDEIGEHVEGMKNKLTLALAPAILSIAQKIESILPSGEKMGEMFNHAFAVIITGGARVVDVLSHFAGAVMQVDAYVLHLYAKFTRIEAAVINVAVAIGKWVMSLPIVGTVIQQVFDTVSRIGHAIISVGKWVYDKVAAMVQAAGKLIAKIPGMGKSNNAASDFLAGVADGEDKFAAAMNQAGNAMGKTNFADKSKEWLAEINKNADAAGKAAAEGIGNPIGEATTGFGENAKKIEEILKHLAETAATAGGQKPKEVFDLEQLHASQAQIGQAKDALDKIAKIKLHIEVDKSLADMAKEIGTFGMSEGHKKLFDLEAMGASGEQLKLADQYIKELDRLEAKKKEQAEADELIKKVRDGNPLTKYQDELKKLDKLHQDGLVSAQVYAMGVAEANKELAKSLKETEVKKIGAETRRFEFKGPAQGPKHADPIEQLTKTAKAQAEDVKQSRFFLSEIYRFQQTQDQATATNIFDF